MRKPLDYYLSLKYPVLLVAEPEEACTALYPDLKGRVSMGEVPEEVKKGDKPDPTLLEFAVKAYRESRRDVN